MKIDKDVEQKIKRLQLYEQNMQALASQKQQFQNQLVEIESALAELETAEVSYKIIANIMVKSEKPALKAELEQKKEMLELHIKTLDKQESSIRDKSKQIQQEVLGTIKNEEDKPK
ncbi:MAG: prefoldin subunit beta [Candidatus Woesearchaeota archaeon]